MPRKCSRSESVLLSKLLNSGRYDVISEFIFTWMKFCCNECKPFSNFHFDISQQLYNYNKLNLSPVNESLPEEAEQVVPGGCGDNGGRVHWVRGLRGQEVYGGPGVSGGGVLMLHSPVHTVGREKLVVVESQN